MDDSFNELFIFLRGRFQRHQWEDYVIQIVIRTFPLCGVKVLHPRTIDL